MRSVFLAQQHPIRERWNSVKKKCYNLIGIAMLWHHINSALELFMKYTRHWQIPLKNMCNGFLSYLMSQIIKKSVAMGTEQTAHNISIINNTSCHCDLTPMSKLLFSSHPLQGWMKTTTLFLMEWISRTPSSLTRRKTIACSPASSSSPTAHLGLRSTRTLQSGRHRRTAG